MASSVKHTHSMTSSVTCSRSHKKKPIRRRRRSTYSISSEEAMAETQQEADPRKVRESRLRYYEAEERRRREERHAVQEKERQRSDVPNTRSSNDNASSRRIEQRTRSRGDHTHRKSRDLKDNETTSGKNEGKDGRRRHSSERVIIRRTIVEEPRGSFISGRLKELRSPPPVSKTRLQDLEAGPSRRESKFDKIEKSASIQVRSDRTVAVAAGIAESVRRSQTTATKERALGRRSPRSPGKERALAEKEAEASVVVPTIAPSVTTQTTSDTRKRSGKPPPPSVLGTIFGAPSPAAKQPEACVNCITCLDDDVPRSKAAKLACSHYYCHECLKRVFTMSVTDPAVMPPRCCKDDHIPLKHVDKLFDTKFKAKWNKKYQEYTAKNRIYCPVRGCGEWIKPAYMSTDSLGRKYGKCGRCKTKVCAACNGKYHTSKVCPKDEGTKEFIEIAEKEGWRRCSNCSAMVERKSGCNHITCRCKAQWCILCGGKWKTCNCPQFNNEVIEQIRQEEAMRGNNPFFFPEEIGMRPDEGMPFREQVAWQRERERREQGHRRDFDRREQERRDADMARRIDAMQFLDPGQDPHADMGALGAALVDALAAPARPMQYPRRPLPPPPMPPMMGGYRGGYPGPPRRRYDTRASERGHSDRGSQASRSRTRGRERVVPRREAGDYRTEAERYRPLAARASQADLRRGRGTRARRSAAAMAGLGRKSTQARVGEWVRHVGDGEGPGPGEEGEWEEEDG